MMTTLPFVGVVYAAEPVGRGPSSETRFLDEFATGSLIFGIPQPRFRCTLSTKTWSGRVRLRDPIARKRLTAIVVAGEATIRNACAG